MKRIPARFLLTKSTVELWEELTGEFILVFDDGELQVDDKSTIYSSYFWDIHRRYPLTPFLVSHHSSSVIKNGRMGSGTHLGMLKNIIWCTHDTYLTHPFPDPRNNWEPRLMEGAEIRDRLAELTYHFNTQLYNDLSYRLEEWITTLDALDFIEVVYNPAIVEASSKTVRTPQGIEATYKITLDTIANDPTLQNNNLSLLHRSGLINPGQLLQCVSHRGFLTEIDGWQFPRPVMSGYVNGITDMEDSLKESRSASKSLAFTKAPLQESEYFSRRLQLVSLNLAKLHRGDCGAKQYTYFNIQDRVVEDGIKKRECDLEHLDGKHFMDDDGILKTIRKTDSHLIGRTLKLRTLIHCQHPDPYGVCSTCYGELGLSVPDKTNLGCVNNSSMSEKVSQNVMSTKHLDSNAIIQGIRLSTENARYLKAHVGGNHYYLADSLKNKTISLIISHKDAINLTDVRVVDNVRMLNITRVTEISQFSIGIKMKNTKTEELKDLDVSQSKRNASLTYEMLNYIKEHGWTYDGSGNYVIVLDQWDYSLPIMSLPMQHENMSDHAKAISEIVESSVKNKVKRDTMTSPDATLVELYNLVTDKLSVNLGVLETVLYTAMIVSAENDDYSLPKAFTDSGLGVMSTTMTGRSLSAAFAFEHHKDILYSPDSFNKKNRMDHPFDYLLVPDQVLKYYPEQIKAIT